MALAKKLILNHCFEIQSFYIDVYKRQLIKRLSGFEVSGTQEVELAGQQAVSLECHQLGASEIASEGFEVIDSEDKLRRLSEHIAKSGRLSIYAGSTAVSYTHLDVYKRQLPESPQIVWTRPLRRYQPWARFPGQILQSRM